ncbi:hypothetical protein [Clostridium sp.]|uniref:hypothetical protein n=1 Tax=Clostridium sp. TaxID=1506 RepID=UPI002FDEDBBA
MINNYSNKIYRVTDIEQNIIVGSLLGDGSLALYGRSKNAYYREHGCDEQIQYRLWKAEKLKNLDFRLLTNCKYAKLCSHSNIFFTKLYSMFYINGIKTITEENIKLLNHPIGLACFYMDDGTLVIDSSKRKKGSIYIFPRISLYTLSFSEDENNIIMDHLDNCFGIKTKIKYRKDGKKCILEINKKEDIINFIDVIKPHVSEVLCMNYKINLVERFEKKRTALKNQGWENINSWKEEVTNNNYTKEEELFILNSKKNGISIKEISEALKRPYWGVVDKIRRMKNNII